MKQASCFWPYSSFSVPKFSRSAQRGITITGDKYKHKMRIHGAAPFIEGENDRTDETNKKKVANRL